jgi:dTDP-4-dehydrorhamnose reductase
MLKLSQTRDTLQVVADQHGVPTYCGDLVHALARVIDDIDTYQGQILHFSNASTSESGITWADFAREIFTISDIHTTVVDCTSAQYPTPARRPMYSVLRNASSISLPDWRDGLRRYLLGI